MPCMGSDELRGGRTMDDASEVTPAGADGNEANDEPAPVFAFVFPFAKGAKGTRPLSEFDPMSAGVDVGSADEDAAGPPATVANDSVVEMPRGTLVDVDRYDSLDRRDSIETARPVLACAVLGTDSDGAPHVYADSVSAALTALE